MHGAPIKAIPGCQRVIVYLLWLVKRQTPTTAQIEW